MSMPQELGLSGQQPNVALAVFFVPYIIFEIPSNIFMKRFTPHVWLSLCILGFGIVMLSQGFIKNYSGLLATRFFLGLFEAGIFPGSFYLISFWYKREESQKRFTIYFCSVIFASAFGGLLASAIAQMDGMRQKSNWRWIFILEGILTIVVAVAAFFFVSDFPNEAKWLSETERHFVLQKSRVHGTESEGKVTRRDLAGFFKEPSNYLGAVMYFCRSIPHGTFVNRAKPYQRLSFQSMHSHTLPRRLLGHSATRWSRPNSIRYPHLLLHSAYVSYWPTYQIDQRTTCHMFSSQALCS